MSGGAEPTASLEDSNIPKIGATVQIHSLQACPEHNGVRGKVEKWDSEKGRFGVRLESTGKLLGLKPANLKVLPGPCDEQKFMVKRLQMLRDAEEWQEVVNLSPEARTVAAAVRTVWPAGASSIWRNLAQAHDSLRKYQGAIDAFEEVRRIAQEDGNQGVEGGVCGQIGRCYQAMGEFQLAIAQHERRLSIATDVGNHVSRGLVLGDLGRCYFALCQYEKAVELHEQSQSILEETGNRAGVATTFRDLGDCFTAMKQYESAVAAHKQGLAIIQKEVSRNMEGQAYLKMGSCYRALGLQTSKEDSSDHLQMAVKLLGQSEALFVQTGRVELHSSASLELAATLLMQAERQRAGGCSNASPLDADGMRAAEQALRAALGLAEKNGLVSASMAALFHLARATFLLDEEDEAIHLLQRHLELTVEVSRVWCGGCGLVRYGEASHSAPAPVCEQAHGGAHGHAHSHSHQHEDGSGCHARVRATPSVTCATCRHVSLVCVFVINSLP